MAEADLEMPQRQTYPHIIGLAVDAAGPLPLHLADQLDLLLEVDANSDLFVLTATAYAEEDNPSTFTDKNGNEVTPNFYAVVGNSGVSVDVAELRGKLKITWDQASTPKLVQFAPKHGFMYVSITENVQDDV